LADTAWEAGTLGQPVAFFARVDYNLEHFYSFRDQRDRALGR
jgi:hypothetical protein